MTDSVSPAFDRSWLAHLVCPRDYGVLQLVGNALVCDASHRYPIVSGVPIMLIGEVEQTISVAADSLKASTRGADDVAQRWQLATLSLSDDEKRGIIELAAQAGAIDPVAAYLVAATNGLMYKHLIGRLEQYPIPELPLPPGKGRRLLDVGCSWGRWTLAAAAAGYEAVGIDPSLGAVLAAERVARQVGAPTRYVVGDARHLPFAPATFDTVFSYSVLQHFSRADAGQAVRQIGRVLRDGGIAKVQMPTRFGVRCLYHQARRGFREGRGFEVRYWTGRALRQLFSQTIGPSMLETDCYFGIGLQASDAPLMPPMLQRVLRASEALKAASRRCPPLIGVADSVFVQSTKHT